MSSNELIPSRNEIDILNVIAQTTAKSNYVKDRPSVESIFCLALYAKEMNIPVMTALLGGLKLIKGNISISAELMNSMIRNAGHSIKIITSTDTECEIEGKRCDNGDSLRVKYTIEDAQRAGLLKTDSGWQKFPSDMLFARCISRLKRRLFPDVVTKAYVDGEIPDDKSPTEPILNEPIKNVPILPPASTVDPVICEDIKQIDVSKISFEDSMKIESLLHPEDKQGIDCYRSKLLNHFKGKYNMEKVEFFSDLPATCLKSIYDNLSRRNEFLVSQEVGA